MAAVGLEMSGNSCRVTRRLLSGSNTIASDHSSQCAAVGPSSAWQNDQLGSLAEQALANVAAGGGDFAQLV